MARFALAVAALCIPLAHGSVLRIPPSAPPPASNATVLESGETMNLGSQQFMEVNLGPFGSAAEACDYCFSSFTKKGQSPAGPVAPFCVCMSYPDGGKHNMFCATPPSAAEYIAKKKGCRCKAKDMEAMGKTTCVPIS